MAKQTKNTPAPTATPTPATRKLFGTDGVRGVANVPPMTPEMALRLGRAITHVARRGKKRQVRVVVGKDTRLSGYMLETALASGICAMGGRVMLSGPIPTPAVAQLTQSMRADAGIVISASHNPYDDNGIKVFGANGFKLPDADEAEIERLMESTELDEARVVGGEIGSAVKLDDARGRYVVFCKNTFPANLTLDGVKVVVDAAHGAAYRVAPAVFSELGASVTAFGVKPNGCNINRDAGALHPDHVKHEVLKRRAALGIALDGDADRVIMVDERGEVVDGDAIMALCALRMLRQERLPKRTLVATVMSNLGLERALKAHGGHVERTAVGDRYVVEAMRSGGYTFGGEQSGHLIFLDHATTGDGIVAALKVLAIMIEEGKPLSELAREAMQRVPQVLLNETFATRMPTEAMKKMTSEIGRVEKALGDRGRVLVRWSGTEPKLRVMVEGEDADQITTFAQEILGAARGDLAPAS
ncbi:phosphoglucosamine mutase [Chondromyces apiculatus]|uniref:Phosphoglucosamine mutase n=1 Tax=Chondromyces apiculatus DSM 436 TaxID=1192034 RepID=A0A017SVJ3_9BACT|nr:phosphoglucosamine mutase [Chondromyces apiculatus]EYF00792.1 Phosphoglucosamine mutase [Chondromyces apiculatus DSM 436]